MDPYPSPNMLIVASAAEIAPEADAAVQVLQLAARLHAAGSDPSAWRLVLKACGEWLGCTGALAVPVDDQSIDAEYLEMLAGRVTRCAIYGNCACGSGPVDKVNRSRCAALAPHLHEAAAEVRNAMHATFFDQLPPTWIVDRRGRVRDCNAAANAILTDNQPIAVVDGLLVPTVAGGGERLRRRLTDLCHETRFSWPGSHGRETTLLLRPLPAGGVVAATLLPEPPTPAQLAPVLVERLKLTPRQGELAAHLLTGQTLSDAARAMDISRDTANQHLAGLLQRVNAPDRKTLLTVLRHAVSS